MKSRTGIIFLALFIVLIAIFKVSLIVGWSKTAGLLMGLFILVYGNYITIAFSLWIRINLRHHETIESQGESVLIVAPHQDDGVAIAGGFAIQTIQNGGRVDVLFMTDGPRSDKKTRRKEAIEPFV